jgi:hypothetical protein
MYVCPEYRFITILNAVSSLRTTWGVWMNMHETILAFTYNVNSQKLISNVPIPCPNVPVLMSPALSLSLSLSQCPCSIDTLCTCSIYVYLNRSPSCDRDS